MCTCARAWACAGAARVINSGHMRRDALMRLIVWTVSPSHIVLVPFVISLSAGSWNLHFCSLWQICSVVAVRTKSEMCSICSSSSRRSSSFLFLTKVSVSTACLPNFRPRCPLVCTRGVALGAGRVSTLSQFLAAGVPLLVPCVSVGLLSEWT